jgi:hypothetical protein
MVSINALNSSFSQALGRSRTAAAESGPVNSAPLQTGAASLEHRASLFQDGFEALSRLRQPGVMQPWLPPNPVRPNPHLRPNWSPGNLGGGD